MNALHKILVTSVCLLASLGVRALEPLTTTPNFTPLTQAELPAGKKLLAGFLETPGSPFTRSFAIERHNADGSVDATFGGGVVSIPVWGYQEGASALAIRSDGAVYVAGMATDPVSQLLGPDGCYPVYCAQYLAVIRLRSDGAIDTSFNGNGRVVLRIGAYLDFDSTPSYATLRSISVQGDGKILVRTGNGSDAALINADGSLDTSFAPPNPVSTLVAGVPPEGANFQDLWWNPAEPGWNISFAHQGDVVFATWATYDVTGKPMWLSMTATQFATGSYAGTVYRSTGPSYTVEPFDPLKVTLTAVGRATLVFSGSDGARFAYEALDVSGTKEIQRYVFGGGVSTCTWGTPDSLPLLNLQGLWYAESQPGWGISFAHQGGTLAITLLTYDLDGSPLWLFGEAYDVYGDYEGTLHRMAGPWFGTPAFAAHPLTGTLAGRINVSRDYSDNLYLSTVINGKPRGILITRYVFRGSGTICK
jgi:uncharacterized delta-60 repeat protein